MAVTGTERTRARDVDRSTACAALDAAYADGQLDGEEHRSRTSAAMAAKTLGELRGLVADLQVSTPPLEPRPAPARTAARRWILVAVIAVVALVVGGIAFGSLRPTAPDGPSPAAPVPGGAVAPRVVTPVALHTTAGLTGLIDAVRAKLGSTQVARAVVYPDYAIVTAVAPDAPHRALNYDYRGGFGEPTVAGTRNAAEPLVDLATVNVPAVLGLLAGAAESLNVPSPTSRYLIIEARGGQPRVAVYASNEFRESGYLDARPNGEVVSVRPFKPQGG